MKQLKLKWLLWLLVGLPPIASIHSQNGNMDLTCCDLDPEAMVCDLEAAGYKGFAAGIFSTEEVHPNCICQEGMVKKQPAKKEKNLLGVTDYSNNALVQFNGHEDFIGDYLTFIADFMLNEQALTSNITVYMASQLCDNNFFLEIINGPGNTADLNISFVLVDFPEEECDILFVKTEYDSPGCDDFTTIERPSPIFEENASFKPGEQWYMDPLSGSFIIDEVNPDPAVYEPLGQESLIFEFNSYIDQFLWDGPSAPWTICGEKLLGFALVQPIYSYLDDAYVYIVKSYYIVGATGDIQIMQGRDYFPGLEDQNQPLDGCCSTTFSGYYEQHACVPGLEEYLLSLISLDIVNVAQKFEVDIDNTSVSVKAYTDIFPSATLKVNGQDLFQYDQPSFVANHTLISEVECDFENELDYPCTIVKVSTRPDPAFYCRYPE